MDLSVTAAKTIEKIASALAEAVEAGERETNRQEIATGAVPLSAKADATTNLVRGGFVERILGELHTGVASPAAQPASVHADKSVENAIMQTFARPHAPASEPLPRADTALPSAQHSSSDFAVPSSLLLPATLIGLQVEHAAAWPMSGRGFDSDPAPLQEARVRDRNPPPPAEEDEQEQRDQEEASEQPESQEHADAPCGVVFLDEDDGAWCEELTRVLRIALAARIPPHALLVAAEQWQRGRCVVLACPQGSDPAGPAWAFVLWPRKQSARNADGCPPALALLGLRVEARLQWSALPSGAKWCQVRVIKEHHPRTGRQLIPASADASGRVPCEVQLGPVLARPLRCCDVCVRISAARRFWAGLGTQWSMHVIVCSHALIDRATVDDAS
jgi:hypothetical protein